MKCFDYIHGIHGIRILLGEKYTVPKSAFKMATSMHYNQYQFGQINLILGARRRKEEARETIALRRKSDITINICILTQQSFFSKQHWRH